jgi:hypothetical protein
MQQYLVDTYKYVYPLMEVRERSTYRNQSFFVRNNTLGQEENLILDKETDSMWIV